MDKETLSVWISLVSALTALAAVSIAPYISYLITRRAAVAGHRETRVNQLREAVANLVGLLIFTNTDSNNLTDEQRLKLMTAKTQLDLMLNFEKNLHEELRQNVADAIAILARPNEGRDVGKFEETSAKIEWSAKKVLKMEWERVKKM